MWGWPTTSSRTTCRSMGHFRYIGISQSLSLHQTNLFYEWNETKHQNPNVDNRTRGVDRVHSRTNILGKNTMKIVPVVVYNIKLTKFILTCLVISSCSFSQKTKCAEVTRRSRYVIVLFQRFEIIFIGWVITQWTTSRSIPRLSDSPKKWGKTRRFDELIKWKITTTYNITTAWEITSNFGTVTVCHYLLHRAKKRKSNFKPKIENQPFTFAHYS